MKPKEMWWALLLDTGNADEGFFYYLSGREGPKLFETKRSATRFLASVNKPPLKDVIQAKVVRVAITADDA